MPWGPWAGSASTAAAMVICDAGVDAGVVLSESRSRIFLMARDYLYSFPAKYDEIDQGTLACLHVSIYSGSMRR
jgi:hypothetical protein